MNPPQSVTLLELQRRVQRQLNTPELRNVWVTAEISDMRVSGGHCYMELLQKEEATGKIVAKCRAAVWANVYRGMAHNFRAVTGQDLATGLKVMLCLSVSYHEAYGLTFVVSDINPEFTMGDLLRRRRESIERLRREGILELNRRLPIAVPTLRIAVVSARGAAGFGDFVNQLYSNRMHLAFRTRLFEARVQGAEAPASIIRALRQIAADVEAWDCVVIIRGGGATSDLISFEDYALAAEVARFPLPVIIGIGHERDVTLLDYVANMRVKTPTAAAEWLIAQAEGCIEQLRRIAMTISQSANGRIQGCSEQLSRIATQLRLLPPQQIERSHAGLQRAMATLASLAATRIAPMRVRLDGYAQMIGRETLSTVSRQRQSLDSLAKLIDALSPEATLRRGFTVTLVDGRPARSASALNAGQTIVTRFADGDTATSVIQSTDTAKA